MRGQQANGCWRAVALIAATPTPPGAPLSPPSPSPSLNIVRARSLTHAGSWTSHPRRLAEHCTKGQPLVRPSVLPRGASAPWHVLPQALMPVVRKHRQNGSLITPKANTGGWCCRLDRWRPAARLKKRASPARVGGRSLGDMYKCRSAHLGWQKRKRKRADSAHQSEVLLAPDKVEPGIAPLVYAVAGMGGGGANLGPKLTLARCTCCRRCVMCCPGPWARRRRRRPRTGCAAS